MTDNKYPLNWRDIPPETFDKIIEQCAIELGMATAKALSEPTAKALGKLGMTAESESEKMQGELEPLPTAKKWDGDDIGEVLKHGRE